jgi:hypothetical protein
MAHELAMNAAGEAMMIYNQRNGTPWHKLGKAMSRLMTANEVLAPINYTTFVAPVHDETGAIIEGWQYSYRLDEAGNKHIFGVQTTEWAPEQNVDFIDTMDQLVGRGHQCFDTAGALFDGRMTFASVDPSGVPGLSIDLPNGEKLRTWFMGTNGHDGRHAVEFHLVTIRPVCWNTVSAAKQGALAKWRAIHRQNVRERMTEIRDAMHMQFDSLAVLRAECEKLVATPTDRTLVDQWLREMFPMEAGREVHNANQRKRVQTVRELAHHGRGNDGKTMWSWYNGFTEESDGRTSKAAARGVRTAMEHKFFGDVFGERSKERERARKMLVAMCG